MGKKNKKEKKEKGAEKTARKSEKKIEKKIKKSRADAGEDDIEVLISKFKEEDRKKLEVTEVKCDPPSPRINFSFTANRTREEIYLFGGEYDSGNRMSMFNDFFVYNCKKDTWKRIEAGNCPPPRSSHQAVLVRSGHGDQLWLFGGEFVSPTETQFYHYRDLWCWHFQERRWEQVKTSHGPQARSGHRMVLWRRALFVFGGFNDNGRTCKYFNDLWQFDLSARQWLEMRPARGGPPPAPRSACLLLASQDGKALYVAGGFSRGGGGKKAPGADEDQGTVFADLHQITVPADKLTRDIEKGDIQGAVAEPGPAREVRWRQIKWCGVRPEPTRAGMSAVCGDGVPGGAALVFGGVHDDYVDVETVQSRFFNELYRLEPESGRWHLCAYRRPKAEEESCEDTVEHMETLALDEESASTAEKMETAAEMTTVSEDGVFTLTVGGGSVVEESAGPSTAEDTEDRLTAACVPAPRMNCGLAVVGHRLLVYGGQVETEKKTRVLDDLHALDLRRMEAWRCLHRGSGSGWVGEDSSDSEDGMEDEDGDEDDELLLDAPAPNEGEAFTAYWTRSEAFWCDAVANGMLDSDDDDDDEEEVDMDPEVIAGLAMKMAKDFHKDFVGRRTS